MGRYKYRLPGLESLSHGVDIITGEPMPAPLFSFSFCDNTSMGIVQDSYRGLTYTIPSEIFASMNTKCSFDASSKIYSTKHSMAIDTANAYCMYNLIFFSSLLHYYLNIF